MILLLSLFNVSYAIIHQISCSDIQFGVEDVHTYAHLLSVALNSKLCQGAINEAMEIGKKILVTGTFDPIIKYAGKACYRITSRMHDISMEMMCLPLLFFTQMVAYEYVCMCIYFARESAYI